MPKATITFNLEEERDDFENAVNANKYLCVISDIKEFLRQKVKYSQEHPKDWYEVQDAIIEIINQEGINV